MDILIYLLKASAISTLFLIVYHVLLKHDTFHQFKRAYLMVGLLISAVLPWLYYTKTVIIETVSNNFSTSLLNARIAMPNNSNVVSTVRDNLTFSWDEILLMVYLLVGSILLARLIFNYAKLLFRIHKTSHRTIENHKVHMVKECINPFSFFNHIVIGEEVYHTKNFEMIFAHEKAHIKQWHSLDILFANLLCVALWFNPLIWFYKKSMVQNLEHIADKVSIETLNDKLNYQYLLLSNSFSTSDLQTIQTTFFQSSIKQRIMMLNKSTTSKIYALKSIIVLPILILFFMNFQAKVVAQEKKSPWKTKATLHSVKYSDSIGTIATNYFGNNSVNINLKNLEYDFIENSKVTDDSLNKNERIAIKITKDASQDFLNMTKKYLKKQYDIDVNYSQVEFNKNNQLTSIKAEVDCNDGFNGSSSQKGSQPIYDFYIYRDYSENTKSPFGLSNELPFSSSKKEKDKITYTTSVIISPGDPEKVDLKSDISVNANTDIYRLKSIEKFIINGKTYKVSELKSKVIIADKHEYVDDKTFKVNGKLFDDEKYYEYLKVKAKGKSEVYIKNLDIIFFSKEAMPMFIHVDELNVSEELKAINTKTENSNSEKNRRIAVKFNKNADKQYLENVKSILINKYNIDFKYSKLRYNKNNEIVTIAIKTSSKDGQKTQISRKSNQPIQDFYFYLYIIDSKIEMGFVDKLSKDVLGSKFDDIKYDSTILMVPSKLSRNEAKVENSTDTISSNEFTFDKQSNEKTNIDLSIFKDVQKFIINDKSYMKNELKQIIVYVNKYKMLDDKTLKIEGEVKGEVDLKYFLNSTFDLKGKKVLIFGKSGQPIFFYPKKNEGSEKRD